MGDGVACLEATAVSAEGCRVGFGGPVQGICVPGCDHSDDCGVALQCVSGVCVPREAGWLQPCDAGGTSLYDRVTRWPNAAVFADVRRIRALRRAGTPRG